MTLQTNYPDDKGVDKGVDKISTEDRIKKQEQELAELRKKQKKEKIESEQVDIPKHKHCHCGRIFWNENPQITVCLHCNPNR